MNLPKIRCSDLDRILACPGSMLLTAMVAPRQGDESLEGTALHHAAAVRIVRDLGGTAPDGLPDPDPNWPSLAVSKWIADYYVRHVAENVPDGWSLEVEVPLSYQFDGFILSGHIDCLAISPDGREAMGWDLKTGYDPVDEAEQNWQVVGYMVALHRAYPSLTKCTFYVVQPRNDEDEGFQRVSKVLIEDDKHADAGDALAAASAGLANRIRQAIANDHELNTGRPQCRWCAAATQCPALRADLETMKLTLTPDHLAAIKHTPDDATLADWVLSSKTLARPMEDAEAMAKERIAANGSIAAHDGTQISVKTTRGAYTCHDRPGLWNAIKELLPEEKMALAAKFSMTELRAQVAEVLNVPLGGRSPNSATNIVEAKTAAFQVQGERKLFVFQ